MNIPTSWIPLSISRINKEPTKVIEQWKIPYTFEFKNGYTDGYNKQYDVSMDNAFCSKYMTGYIEGLLSVWFDEKYLK